MSNVDCALHVVSIKHKIQQLYTIIGIVLIYLIVIQHREASNLRALIKKNLLLKRLKCAIIIINISNHNPQYKLPTSRGVNNYYSKCL